MQLIQLINSFRIIWKLQVCVLEQTLHVCGPPGNEFWTSESLTYVYLSQADVESRGLPPCEGAVNLAGENIMNPMRWWGLFFPSVNINKYLAFNMVLLILFLIFCFWHSRWNENYKNDLFSSRINTTRILAQAIAASPTPPHSWVLVTGVGK